jgi:hypothetical protein
MIQPAVRAEEKLGRWMEDELATRSNHHVPLVCANSERSSR